VVLDGPSDVTIYAASSKPETEITATLNIVAPDGTVTKQADGVLLGSLRELDHLTSWYGTGHALLQPGHPFTMASQQPVMPGQVTRFDIGLLANFTEIPAGYKIQLVLNSQPPASFHTVLAPTPQQLANLAGGVYTIERNLPGRLLHRPSPDLARAVHGEPGRLGTVVLTRAKAQLRSRHALVSVPK